MRVRIFFLSTLLVIFNIALLSASPDDGDPQACLGGEIDGNCPLDTWVIVIAVIAVIFAAVHLRRKQKSLLP